MNTSTTAIILIINVVFPEGNSNAIPIKAGNIIAVSSEADRPATRDTNTSLMGGKGARL